MSTATYEVLYNTCYGGFSFPTSFLEAVFEVFPPDSALGAKLWQISDSHFVSGDEKPDTKWISYYQIMGAEPFKHDYERLILQNFTRERDGSFKSGSPPAPSQHVRKAGTNLIYFMIESHYDDEWRTSPEIIAMARSHGLIGRPYSGSTELQVATVPIGYDYDISEYDGQESVHKKVPYRQIIGELVELYKTRDESSLSALTRALITGTLTAKNI